MSMSWVHCSQTLVYTVQLTLAYWLMLIVMTYNSYLALAVIFGAAFGQWLSFASQQFLKQQPKPELASDVCH